MWPMCYKSPKASRNTRRPGYPTRCRVKASNDIGGKGGLAPSPALSLAKEAIVRTESSLVLAHILFDNPPVQGASTPA